MGATDWQSLSSPHPSRASKRAVPNFFFQIVLTPLGVVAEKKTSTVVSRPSSRKLALSIRYSYNRWPSRGRVGHALND
jgi:hypothetical protein